MIDADARPVLSVVVPLYNEQENIPELYRRLVASLDVAVTPAGYELVLVNDGSRDATAELIDKLADQDPRVLGVHLSRNFGHQPAISAGLDCAEGDAVILMDGDLQDPPEVLGQFIEKWRQGYDVVYAVRRNRKENVFKRCAYFVFYRLFRAISELNVPLDSGDFSLMDRKVVDALRALPERLRFVRGLRTYVGFRQTGLAYDRGARAAGRPKYSFAALLHLAGDGLVSFSTYPLRLVTHLGFASIGVALVLTVWVLHDAFRSKTGPRGWASTIVVVLFMSAIQLLSLGIMGEYVRRIFIESKGRPFYIVGRIATRRPRGGGRERRGRGATGGAPQGRARA